MQFSELSGDLVDRIFVPGQGTAGTVDDWALLIAKNNLTIVSVKLIPNAAITAHATNFFDLNVINKGAAGAGAVVAATRSWAATNSAAFVPESMTLSGTAANLNVAAGDVLDLNRTIAASGLIMPDMTVELTYKIR